MAKNLLILSVFVASPDDVSEERAALEEVVRELNAVWRGTKRIQLELVKWETHAYPSVGDDVQSVVNEQIGDKYDIFIGILWKRFGTPTGRASSGTEEEFNRAYARFRENPRALRIMFYFKNSPVDMREIDPHQLMLREQFQKQLGEKGTLYWEYGEKDNFPSLVRIHLSKHIDDWGKTWGNMGLEVPAVAKTPPPQPATVAVAVSPSICGEEEGFLDLVEAGVERFSSLQELTERITKSLQSLAERISLRTEELQKAQPLPGQIDAKVAKRVCNQAAEDFEQFAKVIEVEVPIFGDTFAKGLDSYARSAALLPDFAAYGENVAEPLKQALSSLSQLDEVMRQARPNVQAFRDGVAIAPRVTTQYNRARRRVLAAIDSFIAEIDAALNQLQETERFFEGLLKSGEDKKT